MSDSNEERRANTRINSALEKFFFAVMSIGVSVVAGVQWQLFEDKAEIQQLLIQHDARIASNYDLIMLNQAELSAVRGQMVGWDVLKRIELYMSSMPPEMANSALTKAIRAESATRRQVE